MCPVPGGAVDEGSSGYGDRGMVPTLQELTTEPADSPLSGERQGVDKISSSVFKLKLGCVKNNYQGGTTRD